MLMDDCFYVSQHNSDINSSAPFLALTAHKEMVLYPIRSISQEASNSNEMEIVSVKSKSEVPFGKWVHIGCEVYSQQTSRVFIES